MIVAGNLAIEQGSALDDEPNQRCTKLTFVTYYRCGSWGTFLELVFEKEELIPAIQQLPISH